MNAPFQLQHIDIEEASLLDLQAAMEEGRLTSRALTMAYLMRIARYDQDGPRINSILEINPTKHRKKQSITYLEAKNMDIVIREFAAGDEDAFGKIDDSFVVDSIIVPSLKGLEFDLAVEPVPSYTKSYMEEKYRDVEEKEDSEYIDNPDRIRYLAWVGNQAAGRLSLTRNWNKYALIEDIAVDRKFRGLGIGRRLIDQAKRWAKSGGMPGLTLETQNNNVNACRFYQSCGFVLGGVDTRLYRGIDRGINETALFWYLLFE